ncbi:hypothetical protein CDD83_3494 [Cordyceps sp. RAO-2017]|nr:hypothetical protein CDD83_3494 [Cordyceps sp. RAO-2017]
MVVTTDVFTYIATVAEILNEGLPRAAWSTIGDHSSRSRVQRLRLAKTLILTQAVLGLGMSVVFLGAADGFARAFVPGEVRRQSVMYVRISSFSALSSALETAVAAAARALDQPDVPLAFSCVKFATNIVLDMLLISTFRVSSAEPTVNMQAAIQLACNLTSAFVVLLYFLLSNRGRTGVERHGSTAPALPALMILLRPGITTLIESAVRNALYLWLVSNIISMGATYATAWGVFNTIRWGLIMIPVSALEATTLTFVGHNWGRWRRETGRTTVRPRASLQSLYRISRPAFVSVALALAFEVPICILMSLVGVRPFARYISGSDETAVVTERMWRTMDWCYVIFAATTQLSAVLLATRPKLYLWQSLASNLLYVLPWAIACHLAHLDESNAWTYHALVSGGSMVFSLFSVLAVLALWAWVLKTGRARLGAVK